jgi:hypothetical protein
MGNFLNAHNPKMGGASGFTLDSFDKIVDIRTRDNKSTLLMYMIARVEEDILMD